MRALPTEALIQAARPNGGLVPFSATARLPERNIVWAFELVCEIGRDGWADTVTPIRWRPSP
jgi:hypothetical protein